MTQDPCDPCTCIPGYMSDKVFYQKTLQTLCDIKANTGSTSGTQSVSSCLEVTTAGAWGSVGDIITETRWYDVSTNPPTLLSVGYYNETTLSVVTGITSGNTKACPGVEIGESCDNPLYSSVCNSAAQGSAPSGNPIELGYEARKTLGVPVADGTVVRPIADPYGRSYITKYKADIVSSAGTPITTATNTQVVAAPAASHHLKVQRITAQNSGATGSWIYWTEGSGGTKKFPMYLAQNQVISFKIDGEWELPTATALYINSATAGANIEWEASTNTVID